MKIKLLSIPVEDQAKALQFYTEKLGFVKKTDMPVGENHRYITIVSKDDPDGPEILLEPSPLHFEPAKTYQKALYDAGIPMTQFDVANVQEDFERLKKAGVVFVMEPLNMGNARLAAFDDTCGNYIQLVEMIDK